MPQTAVDQATAALRAVLRSGRHPPGSRLPAERRLAQELQLSRPSLREAIRQLAESGLLVARHGSGTYVAQVEVEAVFAVRLRLEPWAAELAAEHRSSAQAGLLERQLVRLERHLDDPTGFAATDVAIHALVAKASGNVVLEGVLERLTDLTMLTRAVTAPERDARTATLAIMRELVAAVSARSPSEAAAAMTTHIEGVRAVAQRRSAPPHGV